MSSNGYEEIAAAFVAGRGNPATAEDAVGVEPVRAWARALPANAAVLDIGCGSGFPITWVLIESGLNVHALDASPTLVAGFREHFPRTPVVCEAVETSTFFQRQFDAVVSWGLLFLLSEASQRALLRRIAALLVPGGRLLFTSPAQVASWKDAMTGRPSLSLGAAAYREILAEGGISVQGEFEDRGDNHYYEAVKQGPGQVSWPNMDNCSSGAAVGRTVDR